MTAHFRPICWPFGDWESLFARLWSGRAQFDGISGDFVLHSPLFCGREPFPAVPCQYFSGRGFFVHKFLCAGAGETSPLGFSARFGLNRRQRRRSERRKARARLHARTLEDETSLTTAPGQPDDGGDARRRARKEHTARQAERARQRREDDRPRTAAANAAKARATPATKPTGQRSDGGTAVFRPPN